MVSEWHENVTHLVTSGMPNTVKCQRAAEAGVPIVHEAWVRKCWDDMHAHSHQGAHASTVEAAFTRSHPVPLAPVEPYLSKPLHMQVITVTGPGTQDRRDSYEARIKALGGKFSRQLDPREITLVLADTKQVSTQKAKAAIKHNIPIVTLEWLQKVEESNVFCPLNSFYVDLALGIKFDGRHSSNSASPSFISGESGMGSPRSLNFEAQDSTLSHKEGDQVTKNSSSSRRSNRSRVMSSSNKIDKSSASFSSVSQTGRRGSLRLRLATGDFGEEEDDDDFGEQSSSSENDVASGSGPMDRKQGKTHNFRFSSRKSGDEVNASLQDNSEFSGASAFRRTGHNMTHGKKVPMQNNQFKSSDACTASLDKDLATLKEFATRCQLKEKNKVMGLDGCRIAIYGFHLPNRGASTITTAQGCIRSILRRTGGIFLEDVEDSSITHVIVPNDFVARTNGQRYGTKISVDSAWAPLPATLLGAYGPHIVTLKWLYKSVDQGQAAMAEFFKCVVSSGKGILGPVVSGKVHSGSAGIPNTKVQNHLPVGKRNQRRAESAPPYLSTYPLSTAKEATGTRLAKESSKNPDISKSETPFNHKSSKASVKPLKGMTVSVSGYSGAERAEVRKISRRLGGTYDDSLDRHCKYLVCKKADGLKYKKACEFSSTHIVTLDWLRECERIKRLVKVEDNVPKGKIFWHRKVNMKHMRKKRRKNYDEKGKKDKKVRSPPKKRRVTKAIGAKGVKISFSDVARGIEKNRRRRSQSSQQSQSSQLSEGRQSRSLFEGHNHHNASNESFQSHAPSQEDTDFSALQKELLQGGSSENSFDVSGIFAKVQRGRGAQTTVGSQDVNQDILELPADYYAALPQQKLNIGTPPIRDGEGVFGGTNSRDGVGNSLRLAGMGEPVIGQDEEEEDESQGVRWGSDEEDHEHD